MREVWGYKNAYGAFGRIRRSRCGRRDHLCSGAPHARSAGRGGCRCCGERGVCEVDQVDTEQSQQVRKECFPDIRMRILGSGVG